MIIRNKPLIIAIAASALWHLFWMASLRIQSFSDDGRKVKFTSVSFFGPVLESRIMNIQVASRPRSVLEERFSRYAETLFSKERSNREAWRASDIAELDDELLAVRLSQLVSGEKAEPTVTIAQ